MPNYADMIASLQAELERVTQVRDKAQDQMGGLIKAIKAIEVLAEELNEPIEPPPMSPDEEKGFTDQVRAILRANPFRAFAALDIRDLMLKQNPEADPKITLIHAHNTLKRLAKQSEVTESAVVDGVRTSYRWNAQTSPVIDLMASLKKSLADMEKKRIDDKVAKGAEIRQREK